MNISGHNGKIILSQEDGLLLCCVAQFTLRNEVHSCATYFYWALFTLLHKLSS
jgi:hypothetical protein